MGVMPPSPTTIPNFHFLLIAPNLGPEWFFDAARAYWEKFRPIVVSDLELVRLIPRELSVAVTVIARRDSVAQWGVTFAQLLPNALFDPVTFDLFDEMKRGLDERAERYQPFGVAINPTAVPPTAVVPTPGSVLAPTFVVPPTRAPGGFVTQTPTPGGPAPTEVPQGPTPTPPVPLYPTPGPITGG